MIRKQKALQTITNGWIGSYIHIIYKPRLQHHKPIIIQDDAIEMIRECWDADAICLQEQVMAFYLNNGNKLIGYRLISTGTTNACLVDIKLLVSLALHCLASFVIVAHNHPSGNTKPSQQDIKMTEKVKEALALIDIKLLDHFIITSDAFLSFSNEGYL